MNKLLISSGALITLGLLRLFRLSREIKKGSIEDGYTHTTVNRDDGEAAFKQKTVFIIIATTGLIITGVMLFIIALGNELNSQ